MTVPNLSLLGSHGSSVYGSLTPPGNGFPRDMGELGRMLAAIDPGTADNATCTLAGAAPTAHDTATIGADVYEFMTAGGTLNNAGHIGVVIGSAQATLTNWLAAINARVSTPTGLKKPGGVLAALTNGTAHVWARDLGSDLLLIQSADKAGGTVMAGPLGLHVAETFTNAGNFWDVIQSGASTLMNQGRSPRQFQLMVGSVTITTDLITFGTARMQFVNQNGVVNLDSVFLVSVLDSTGATKTGFTDTFAVDGNAIVVTLGGAGGDLANGDVLTVLAATTPGFG